MKKYIIAIGCVLCAQVTFVQADWLTWLFETPPQRYAREKRETAEFQAAVANLPHGASTVQRDMEHDEYIRSIVEMHRDDWAVH
jgi:hypothetical protein